MHEHIALSGLGEAHVAEEAHLQGDQQQGMCGGRGTPSLEWPRTLSRAAEAGPRPTSS